jgi:hypothetical protein
MEQRWSGEANELAIRGTSLLVNDEQKLVPRRGKVVVRTCYGDEYMTGREEVQSYITLIRVEGVSHRTHPEHATRSMAPA